MTEIAGIDVAWTKPPAAAIKAAGYSFAIGYLSTDTSKNLTAAFVADCHAHGIAVGAVWETTSARALAGQAAGVTDAQKANTQAAALGIPTAVPVYFAVDTDTTVAKVTGYFEGVRSSSAHPVGAYGSLAVVDGLLKAGLAVVGWQTSAWSGGKVSTRAHLYQRQKHTRPPISGVPIATYDEDVLLASDLAGAGLWLPGTPTPPPVQEDDDMAAIILQATGDTRVYLVNPAVGTKLYIPDQAAMSGHEFFKAAVQPDGKPYPTSPEYLSSLADLTSLVAKAAK